MTDQKLTDELEKALRDEAYDGGTGALSPEQFTDYVRGLAVAAAKVAEEAHTLINGSCWDEAPMVLPRPGECAPMPPRCELTAGHLGAHRSGTTEWMHGPGRTPADDERAWAEYRDAAPENNTPDQRRAFFAALRRSEVPEPSIEQMAAYRKLADRAHAALALPRGRLETTKTLAGLALPLSVALDHFLASAQQGEPSDAERYRAAIEDALPIEHRCRVCAMSGQVTAAVKTMTPEFAREILHTKNTHNRPMSHETVERFAQTMAAGNWQVSDQTIKFARDGRLLDGQHRLAAVAQAGMPVEFLVIEGLEHWAVWHPGGANHLNSEWCYTCELERKIAALESTSDDGYTPTARESGCFGHCDPEGWHSPCRVPVKQEEGS